LEHPRFIVQSLYQIEPFFAETVVQTPVSKRNLAFKTLKKLEFFGYVFSQLDESGLEMLESFRHVLASETRALKDEAQLMQHLTLSQQIPRSAKSGSLIQEL
jgi:hypothetical protein